ncbi:MAG TPA: FadR/GntR family transcriptional regulator [Syntrophales bacterium]|nr:FadR/GntR family transcriptional regulator [Syntrophales bacterium]HPQ42680.1 FadR/GntR family transcriptional regulator [Syntrophales bacterium]
MKLSPIKPKRISDQVFDQLQDFILRGKLNPGERIMSERELSTAFDVSRTSVREAINRLTTMGFLEQRQGRGTFVSLPSFEKKNALAVVMQGKHVSLEDLLEVRMGLECNATYLAAERANEKDIYLMRQSVKILEESTEKGIMNADADVSFHMAIAYATRNSVHIQIMRDLYDYLRVGITENQYHLLDGANEMKEIVKQHIQITDMIDKHDPELAYQAMFSHLRFCLDFVKTKKQSMAQA